MNALRAAGFTVGTLPPGSRCSIADVPGVRVGHTTVWEGDGAGAVRTGVTAVIPPGDPFGAPLPAGVDVLHGYGKATGLWQVAHLGMLESPVLLTNTLATFRCADALISWTLARHPKARSVNPVVLECNDGWLSAIQKRPVTEAHALAALDAAAPHVEEGCVGVGTGMVAYELKSGVGTASCAVDRYTVGALVVPNMGRREDLLFLGKHPDLAGIPRTRGPDVGSVVVVLATDAPLRPHELGLLARRGVLGLARTGAPADMGSGDFVLIFSTGPPTERGGKCSCDASLSLRGACMAKLLRACAQVTEEAVLSALLAAQSTAGRDGRMAYALPRHPLG